jgi:hypothetical protein
VVENSVLIVADDCHFCERAHAPVAEIGANAHEIAEQLAPPENGNELSRST